MHHSKRGYFIMQVFIIVVLLAQSTVELRAQDKQIQTNNITNMPLETVILYSFKATHYTVKKGQELIFSCEQTASIGYTTDYRIEDRSIIECVDIKEDNENDQEENITYEINEDEKLLILVETEESNGAYDEGDGAYEGITYVFKALKTGNSKIIIRQYYRSSLEKKYEFNITVE